MRYILSLLTCLILLSQCATQKQSQVVMSESNYDKYWKKIDSLQQQGLYKSALEETETLYTLAEENGDKVQKIKALITECKMISQLEEDHFEKIIARFEAAIAEEEDQNTKALLYSYAGELYYNYAQQNQYRINRRTNGAQNADDLSSMTMQDLIAQSNAYYINSVSLNTLKNTPVDQYSTLIIGADENWKQLDLYSFLSIRAAKHFKEHRSLLPEPVNAFSLMDQAAFATGKEFAELTFSSSDESSFTLKTLKFYQEVLQYLDAKQETYWYNRVNLDRLLYVNQQFKGSDKVRLFEGGLKQMITDVEDIDFKSFVAYQLANLYYQQGSLYSHNYDRDKKPLRAKARFLAKEYLEKYPTSKGAPYLKNLTEQIEIQSLSVTMEEVVPVNKAHLIRVEFQNINDLHLKVVSIKDENFDQLLRLNQEELKPYLNRLPAVKEWSKSVNSSDYNTHATELIVDPLPSGSYVLLVSDDDSFQNTEAEFHWGGFQVSNLAYQVENGYNHLHYVVTDRTTGAAIQGAKLEFFEQKYNSRKRTRDYKKLGESNTDQNGFARSTFGNRRGVKVVISKGTDVLDLESYQSYYPKNKNRTFDEIVLLTDRNLYRPGQQIHVKAIVLRNDGKGIQTKVVSNESVELILRDSNGREIYKSNFETNEFGSLATLITLPDSGLNGSYNLSAKSTTGNGHHNIKVEEYKRTRFEVVFDEILNSYALNDTISVQGHVAMFSGVALANAQVRYRIYRETRYRPFYYGRYSRGYPSGQAQEIGFGTVETDGEGYFKIEVPLVGASTNEKWNPRYSFNVTADVVDDTGETQSGKTSIAASKDKFFFSLSRNGTIDASDLDSFQLQIKNIKDIQVNYKGQLSITKLKQPITFKKQKYWDRIDTLVEESTAYQSKVPFDFIGDASGYQNWDTAKKIGSYPIDNVSSIHIGDKINEAGVYKIEVKEGDKVLFEDFVNIHNFKAEQFTLASLLYTSLNKESFEPGDQLELKIGTGLNSLRVLYELEKDREIVERKWITLNQNAKDIYVPVTEKDRGGFVVHLSTIYKNRFDKKSMTIAVPWTNKDLDIELSHFRSTIKPGAQEEWTVTIKGNQAQHVSSELIASMYDISLDQLYQKHEWSSFINLNYHSYIYKQVPGFGSKILQQSWRQRNYGQNGLTPVIVFPDLNWFDLQQYLGSGGSIMVRGSVAMKRASAPPQAREESAMVESTADAVMMDQVENQAAGPPSSNEPGIEKTDFDWSQVRKNLQETAFFFPQLQTDKEGNVQLKFTMSEALTQWKLMLLAHSKTAQSGYKEFELKTSKSLMVFPNVPRFGRVGDQVFVTSKVSNLTDKSMSGKVRIEIVDPVTNKVINTDIVNGKNEQTFNLNANKSQSVQWVLDITEAHQAGLIYRVLATSDKESDGEESYLPILTNQVFLTESLPIYVKGNQKKSIEFSQLKSILASSSSKVKQVTLEWVSNPTWYAVQALPYLAEKKHESAEQIFHRFFANRLGTKIIEGNPEIEQTFKTWKALDQDALQSPLYKNQDLKSSIIEETPWLRQADNENTQRQNIAQFFDKNQLKVQQETALQKLLDLQNGDGGFSWYPGSRSSVYITARILEGMNRLKALDALQLTNDHQSKVKKAHTYLSDQIRERLAEQKDRKYFSNGLLYLIYVSLAGDETQNYSIDKDVLLKDWQKRSVRDQALLALVLFEMEEQNAYKLIMASLKERVIRSNELGYYWNSTKDFSSNRSRLDEQVFLLQLFQEVEKDDEISDGIKMWLIRNKHTNHWKSTSATASAIYGLLIQNDDSNSWLATQKPVKISVNNKALSNTQKSAGTLYFRKNWTPDDLNSETMKLEIENQNQVPGWGALYVQYFEDIDQVKNDLQDYVTIEKSIFVEENSDSGPVLHSVEGRKIEPGDKIVVRLKLTSDRPLEYVHLKDLRAAGTEPIGALSEYKYQDGLSYYEMTKDASAHFFISFMQKGSYVFEYRLRANLGGEFSSGMASLQCMYAPEFVTHSNSIALEIKK